MTESPRIGVAFPALCGARVVPAARDFGKWLDPTCPHCDHEIRVRSGFPPHEIPPLENH